MPKQPKVEKRKPGRPKLAAEHAKGKIVPVRFAESEIEAILKAAEKQGQTVSQWIRGTLSAALEG
jgi:predicted DNA binding CopG/RHH family protein